MNELSNIVKLIGVRYKFQLKDKLGQIEITVTDRTTKRAIAQILPIDHFDQRVVDCVKFCIAKIEEEIRQKLEEQKHNPIF